MSSTERPSQGLFRKEALQGGDSSTLGSIQINTPPAFWAVSILSAAFMFVAVCYLCVGHYTRRATVEGMLVPAAGLVTLAATGVGQVVRVDVHQGQRVSAGQVLAEFDNPLDSVAVGNTLSFIGSKLDAERTGLRQDLTTQRSLSQSQSVALKARITSLRAQLAQVSGQLALQRQEASTMAALLKRITPLSKQGYVSIYELQQQQADTFNAEVQVRALRRERLAIVQRISGAAQQLRRIPLTLVAQQNSTRNKLAQVAQALAQNEAQRDWVLKAPRAGAVSALLVKPGQAVMAGEPLLTVLPTGSQLEAQLMVPSSAIGFVRTGQRVVFRYTAFPYQKFGLHFGEVVQVSRSALSAQEVSTLVGRRESVPLYRVLVRLNSQNVQAYRHSIALLPGMALRADILLDRRRLIEWVLEPLYGFERRMTARHSGITASASETGVSERVIGSAGKADTRT